MSEVDKKKHDPLLDIIGEVGRWQWVMFVLTSLTIVPGTFAILVITFMNAKVPFWCKQPDNLVNPFTIEEWRLVSGQNDTKHSCQMWDRDYNTTTGLTHNRNKIQNYENISCPSYEFDHSKMEMNILMEWSLVCGDSYKLSIGQSVYFLGMCTGVFISGMLCDRFGRKTMMIILALLVSVCGIISAFMPNFESFLFIRFLSAQGSIGCIVAVTAYLMEVSGGKWPTFFGVAMEYFWVSAWLILGILAILITNWRYLTLAISIPGFLLIPLIWCMHESPRWLLATGQKDKAEEIVKKVAAWNKRPVPENLDLHLEAEKGRQNEVQNVKTANFFDLFRYPQLRAKTLIIFVNFFSNSLTYYGLTMNSGDLNPDIFMNFMINGLCEIPAITLGLVFIFVTGKRKLPYVATLALSGLFLIIMAIVPKDESGITVLVLSVIGKFFVTISFAIIYPYSSELFPTVLRTTGTGAGCMLSRVAGAVASWVSLLVTVNIFVPTTIYGLVALVAAGLAMLLPEPEVNHLPDSIEEGEKIKIGLPCIGILRRRRPNNETN